MYSVISLSFANEKENTSSNSLVGKLIREGNPEIKITMEDLLQGKTFCTEIDEQIMFDQLDYKKGQSGACFWPAAI